MRRSLQLLKNGFHGSTSVSSPERSSSTESKNPPSELKPHVFGLVERTLSEVSAPQRKLILTMINQALVGTDEADLLRYIGAVYQECGAILAKFKPVVIDDGGQFRNLASDTNGAQ